MNEFYPYQWNGVWANKKLCNKIIAESVVSVIRKELAHLNQIIVNMI